MTKTRKNTARAPAETPAPAGVVVSEEDYIDPVQDLLDRLQGGSGYVKIEKARPNGGRPEYVTEVAPEQFSEADLQARFGGGDYVVTVLDSTRRYRGQARIAIAGLPGAPAHQPAAAPSAPSGFEALLAELIKSNQQIAAALITSRSAADGGDRSRLLADFKLIRDILGPQGQSGAAEGFIAALRQGIELARDSAAAGGGDGGGMTAVLFKALDTLGPSLAELVTALKRPSQAPAAALPAPAMPGERGDPALAERPGPRTASDVTAAQTIAGAATVREGEMGIEQAMLREWLPKLIDRAVAQSDPLIYADLILDQVPPFMLKRMLPDNDAELLERLAAVDARVNSHAQWFRELGAAVRSGLVDVAPVSGPTPAES